MSKKVQKEGLDYTKSMKNVLEKFDLRLLMKWMKKYRVDLYAEMLKHDQKIQTATMCKMICNRTDMMETDAYKKARNWLKENNMGGLFF